MAKRTKKVDPVETIYNQYFNCVQVDMMDINKISKDIEQVLAEPADGLRVAKLHAIVARYRKN